jgi:hypothetical protein
LAGIIQSAPSVTSAEICQLRLTVRKRTKSRVGRPETWPRVSVVSANGHRVRLRLSESGPVVSRGKPAGVAGAAVFSFVGNLPPAEESRWKYEGNATRLFYDIRVPSSLPPGARIWFTAAWFNRRGERGPVSQPTNTHLGFGLGLSQAA